MVYVVGNWQAGYLHVGNDDKVHWVKSPFNADKFTARGNAERNAAYYAGVVVEIPDDQF